jgi:hypothetical protein
LGARFVVGSFRCQEDGGAGPSFAAEQADFNTAFSRTICDDRSVSAFNEVDEVDRLLRHFKLFAQRQVDRSQMRFQQRKVYCRKAGQNPIGERGRS